MTSHMLWQACSREQTLTQNQIKEQQENTEKQRVKLADLMFLYRQEWVVLTCLKLILCIITSIFLAPSFCTPSLLFPFISLWEACWNLPVIPDCGEWCENDGVTKSELRRRVSSQYYHTTPVKFCFSNNTATIIKPVQFCFSDYSATIAILVDFCFNNSTVTFITPVKYCFNNNTLTIITPLDFCFSNNNDYTSGYTLEIHRPFFTCFCLASA